jgi:hypothetical protein
MNKYYTLCLLSALIFMGCSTYTIKDFTSKDKFYQSFNKSVGQRDIDITLTDNSKRTIFGGGTLKQDTLYTLTGVFPVESIKKINYSAKDGSELIGILSGFLIGRIAAALAIESIKKKGDWGEDYEIVYFVFMVPAAIIGGVTGYFIGWNTTYQFNP